MIALLRKHSFWQRTFDPLQDQVYFCIIGFVINHGLVKYSLDLLKFLGFACCIPFGSMVHLALRNYKLVSTTYIIGSTLLLILGIFPIYMGFIIKRRYESND